MPLPEASTPEAVAPPKKEPFFYGGQAVIEGVMMRGKRHYAVAVRLPTTRQIVVDRGELKAAIYVNPFWKLPFVRGLALIGEQLHLGMKALMWSANMNAGSQGVEIGKKEIRSSVAVAGVFALLIFIGLPLLLAGLAVHQNRGFVFVLVEGIIRVGLVLGYLSLIALLRDVRRVFQYHGAEHKTINAYESGWPLEVASVRRASLLHPRCGTGFLLVVLVVSVIVFSVVALFNPNWFWLIASRSRLRSSRPASRPTTCSRSRSSPLTAPARVRRTRPEQRRDKAQGGQAPLAGNPPNNWGNIACDG